MASRKHPVVRQPVEHALAVRMREIMSTGKWLVTGTSHGFGKTLRGAPLQRGHRVVGATRNGPSDMTHEKLTVMKLDITDEDQIEQVIEKLGRIDFAVNNAGFGTVGALEEVSAEEAKATFNTNFFGTFLTSFARYCHTFAQTALIISSTSPPSEA